MCEEGPDPSEVVESNSTRSGHGGDVTIAAQHSSSAVEKNNYRKYIATICVH